ncbi:MAG: S8 family serine peptidase [Methylovirgula sp.]
MRSASRTLGSGFLLLLSALLLTAFCADWTPASAQFRMGGFGRLGGYGRPMMGGRFAHGGPMPRGRGRAYGSNDGSPREPGRRIIPRRYGWNEGGRRYYPGYPAYPVYPRYPIYPAYPVGVRHTPHHLVAQNAPPAGPPAIHHTHHAGGNDHQIAAGEQRHVPHEIITEFSPGASPRAIDRLARRYDLVRLESQNFALIGSQFYRWRVGDGRAVEDVVRALRREQLVASVQPNYVFTLQEQSITPIITRGDPAQYVLDKLQVEAAHRLATGKHILVAVIDSDIDTKHPDLGGTIIRSFDALGGGAHPHQHGTAMAGAIAAHGKLLGIAPDAQILAAHAFGDTPGTAMGTSFAIYKSLQWAADNGARIVNMSFAGPPDPTLHRFLAAAYQRNMVLIAAAGNAGPASVPLYPAADPDVIAVTATDSDDGLYRMANRGQYIAIAAPGVEILVIAPGEAYEITTGTSVAAAHISGIAALLLERKASLKPADIRAILMGTAKPLGPPDQNAQFGAGLANAFRAALLPSGSMPVKPASVQAKR